MADETLKPPQAQQQQPQMQRTAQMQQTAGPQPQDDKAISAEEQAALDRLYAAIHGYEPKTGFLP